MVYVRPVGMSGLAGYSAPDLVRLEDDVLESFRFFRFHWFRLLITSPGRSLDLGRETTVALPVFNF